MRIFVSRAKSIMTILNRYVFEDLHVLILDFHFVHHPWNGRQPSITEEVKPQPVGPNQPAAVSSQTAWPGETSQWRLVDALFGTQQQGVVCAGFPNLGDRPGTLQKTSKQPRTADLQWHMHQGQRHAYRRRNKTQPGQGPSKQPNALLSSIRVGPV